MEDQEIRSCLTSLSPSWWLEGRSERALCLAVPRDGVGVKEGEYCYLKLIVLLFVSTGLARGPSKRYPQALALLVKLAKPSCMPECLGVQGTVYLTGSILPAVALPAQAAETHW